MRAKGGTLSMVLASYTDEKAFFAGMLRANFWSGPAAQHTELVLAH